MLKTWSKAFPGTVQDQSDIPADLMPHLRYPQDLFKVQRDLLGKYHMTDPKAFYSSQDIWTIPNDPTKRRRGQVPAAVLPDPACPTSDQAGSSR